MDIYIYNDLIVITTIITMIKSIYIIIIVKLKGQQPLTRSYNSLTPFTIGEVKP